MFKNNKIFILSFLNAFIYSFYPILIVFSEKVKIAPLSLAFYITLQLLIVLFFYLKYKKIKLLTEIKVYFNNKNFKKYFLIYCIATLNFPLTIYSFYLTDNKIILTLINNIYPLFMIIFSIFIFKEKTKMSLFSWSMIFISFFGLSLIFIDDLIPIFNGDYHWNHNLLGNFLMLISTMLIGLLIIVKSKIVKIVEIEIKKRKIKNQSQNLDIINTISFILKLADFFIFGLILLFSIHFNLNEYQFLNLNQYFIIFLFLFFYIGNILNIFIVNTSNNHSIFSIYFIVPILSMLILYLTGYGTFSYLIIVSTALILIPSFLVNH